MKRILSAILSLILLPVLLLVTCIAWIFGINDGDAGEQEHREQNVRDDFE
jgi:hypothetical protein